MEKQGDKQEKARGKSKGTGKKAKKGKKAREQVNTTGAQNPVIIALYVHML